MRKSFITAEEGEHIDNYEKVCETWRHKFLEMDHEALIRRFNLKHDNRGLYITYYNQEFCLDYEYGMITLVEEPDKVLGFNTIIGIYNLFYYAKEDAKVKGEFVPYRMVKRGAPFAPAFEKTIVAPFARGFDGHLEAFLAAGEALSGERVRQGDGGFIIKAFDWMPIEVLFWDGDEEFPAQANILFDADITDFLHEETVVGIGSDVVKRMAEEAFKAGYDLPKLNDLLGAGYVDSQE